MSSDDETPVQVLVCWRCMSGICRHGPNARAAGSHQSEPAVTILNGTALCLPCALDVAAGRV